MTTDSAVFKQPLWVAALLASAGSGSEDHKIQHRVCWESGRASLRLTNGGSAPVFIPSLNVHLAPGKRVAVRWPAGATAYECQIECAQAA